MGEGRHPRLRGQSGRWSRCGRSRRSTRIDGNSATGRQSPEESLMTDYIQNPVLWALLIAVIAAVALIVRQRRAARTSRQEFADLRARHDELENGYAKSVEAAQERADEATKTVLKSAMRTLQGLAAEQQLIVSRLQNKYGE